MCIFYHEKNATTCGFGNICPNNLCLYVFRFSYTISDAFKTTFTEVHHVLVSVLHICDELLQEGVGKSLLYSWSVQFLWLWASANTQRNIICLFCLSQIKTVFDLLQSVINSDVPITELQPYWNQMLHPDRVTMISAIY